ncbi:hypothetical protein [Sulfurimonas sp.]|uniref:hypothetical protein n=1 Tax=Sulfurimonas sp. TaxID=2022749 RepID=UPI002AB31041|nr:hypothetical protein [Sulfurimonas sp.]
MQLYALCDEDLLNRHKLSLSEFINIAKEYNAVLIQYRNKNIDIPFIKQQLIQYEKIMMVF